MVILTNLLTLYCQNHANFNVFLRVSAQRLIVLVFRVKFWSNSRTKDHSWNDWGTYVLVREEKASINEKYLFFFKQRNLDWFPRMRTSSLDIQEDKNKEDQDSRVLKLQMEDANKAIKTLSMELAELQKLVRYITNFVSFCQL